ncbi:MAG: hypothetical protein WCT42_01110 [Candidatus Paceibacterota bacterium]
MENKYKIKQIILIALIILIVGGVVFSIYYKKETPVVLIPDEQIDTIDKPKEEDQKPISLCYYRGEKMTSGFYEVAWLKINTNGSVNDKVTGEFQNLPAESDSKVGKFEGTVGPLDQKIMARKASVWWDSRAEGMEVKEELAIQFGDGSATVGFGEMVDRGDGVYVYKDKTNLYYIKAMSQMDCDTLDEKLFTEKYIRDNIKTLAINKPVLGGEWYVISVSVNPATHTAEATYEDGHIQSKANIIYTYTKNPQSVKVTKFEVVK